MRLYYDVIDQYKQGIKAKDWQTPLCGVKETTLKKYMQIWPRIIKWLVYLQNKHKSLI